jgi:DNA repair protein SbcC/Rad50
MKTVIFNKVITENYGPFPGRMELEFCPKKFIFIFGPNGSGKTTLLNALPFSLYGITSKGEEGDDMINYDSEKNSAVFNYFTVDGVPYVIEKYNKYSSKGTTVLLKRDGIEIKKGHKEVVPYIEQLIQPRNLFINTLFFSPNKEVIFSDLREPFNRILNLDKYKLYRGIVSDRLNKLQKDFNENLGTINTKNSLITNNTDLIVSMYKSQAEVEERKRGDINKLQEDLKTIIQDLKDSISKTSLINDKLISEEAQKIRDDIALVTFELNTVNDMIKDAKKSLQDKKNLKISELNKSKIEKVAGINESTRNLVDGLIEKYSPLEEDLKFKINSEEKEIRDLNHEKDTIQLKISFLDSDLKKRESKQSLIGVDVCPTCEQEISEETVANLREKENDILQQVVILQQEGLKLLPIIKSKQKSVDINKSGLKILTEERDEELKKYNSDKDKQIKDCEDKLKALLQKLDSDAETQLIKILTDVRQKETELKNKEGSFKSKLSEKEKHLEDFNLLKRYEEQLQRKIDDAKKEIENKKKEEYDPSQIDVLREKIESSKEEIEELVKENESIKNDIKIYNFWDKGFSPTGIPNLSIDDSLPYMNERIKYYMDTISHGRYTVSFDTLGATKKGELRDKVVVNVLDNLTKTKVRYKFSKGQNRLVDICTILTLRDLQSKTNNVSYNILILDEILDALDNENRRMTIGALRRILNATDNMCINLVAHTQVDFIEREIDEILNF